MSGKKERGEPISLRMTDLCPSAEQAYAPSSVKADRSSDVIDLGDELIFDEPDIVAGIEELAASWSCTPELAFLRLIREERARLIGDATGRSAIG